MTGLRFAAALLVGSAAACAGADVPPDPDAVRDAAIGFFESRLRAQPDDILAPAALADRYLARFGITRDFTDVTLAESALARGLARHPRHAPFLARLAAVHLARHEFPEALRAARFAWNLAPREALNARLFDTWFEVGGSDSAVAALNRMDPHSWDHLIRKARLAQAHDLFVTARAALLSACRSSTVDEPRLVAWCAVRLGDVERAAEQPRHAARHYRAALAAVPEYAAALAGLANLSLEDGDLERAHRLFTRTAAAGDLTALLPLARLAADRGDVDGAAALRARFRAAATRPEAGRAYWPYLATLLAEEGRVDSALALARRDVAQRPSPEAYGTLRRILALRDRGG